MSRWREGSAVALLALGVLGPMPACATTLDSVLAVVSARNPALAASVARAEAARERVTPAGAWENPMLELGVQNVPTSGGFDMDPMTMKTLGVTQRISPWGRLGLARRAAGEAAGAVALEARLDRQQALGAAVEAYAAAWAAGERVSAAERHLGVMSRMNEAARSRYAAGAGRLDEVLRARAEEARTRAALVAFRSEQRRARVRLWALRGYAPEFEGAPLAEPRLAPVPDDVATWQAAVGVDHPRLRAGDAEIAQYRLAAGAARRARWPDLELMYEHGFRGTLADGTPQDDMFSARVGLMLPVFAGQREGREAAEMEAMARMAEGERRAANIELLESVALAHDQALAATATTRLLADTVIAVQRSALEAAWSAYAAGSLDLSRVLDVAHALYDEELELARTRGEAMEAQGRFLAITGRGDLIGINLPAEEKRTP